MLIVSSVMIVKIRVLIFVWNKFVWHFWPYHWKPAMFFIQPELLFILAGFRRSWKSVLIFCKVDIKWILNENMYLGWSAKLCRHEVATINGIIGPSSVNALHGTKCILFFSFSQKGFAHKGTIVLQFGGCPPIW